MIDDKENSNDALCSTMCARRCVTAETHFYTMSKQLVITNAVRVQMHRRSATKGFRNTTAGEKLALLVSISFWSFHSAVRRRWNFFFFHENKSPKRSTTTTQRERGETKTTDHSRHIQMAKLFLEWARGKGRQRKSECIEKCNQTVNGKKID